MTGPSSTPPPADDEVERRLAALKAGVEASRDGGDHGDEATDGGGSPALAGEVIDAGRSWRPGDDPGGGAGAPRRGPGGGAATSPPGVGGRVVWWSFDQAQAGRFGLWIGVGLVAFGGYLALAELVPGVAVLGSVATAAVGVVLVAWHLRGRAGAWAVHAGVVLAGFGIARLVASVASLPQAGWGTLGAGLGLLLIAAVRVRRREGVRWQAWVGGALAIWGGWGVLGATVPGFPTLGDLIVPSVLVLIGVVFLRRGARRGAG